MKYSYSQYLLLLKRRSSNNETITVGKSPDGIAVNPETNMIYVPNGDSNSTSVIDGKTNRVVANVTVGNDPHVIVEITSAEVAVNPVTNKVYVTRQDEYIVSVIDGSNDRVLANITVGFQPHGIAVNPVTKYCHLIQSP